MTHQRRLELAQVVVRHRWKLREMPEEDDPSVIVWAGRLDLDLAYDFAASLESGRAAADEELSKGRAA